MVTSKTRIYAKRVIDPFNLSQYFSGVFGLKVDETRRHESDLTTYALTVENIQTNNIIGWESNPMTLSVQKPIRFGAMVLPGVIEQDWNS